MESVDAADLHDAANRLHEIVEEVVRRGQQNQPLENVENAKATSEN
jgi:hypothetical protein